MSLLARAASQNISMLSANNIANGVSMFLVSFPVANLFGGLVRIVVVV